MQTLNIQTQIIGLGYVGLTLAVYLANMGFKVHGVEISNVILNNLANKKAHFFEKDFDSKLRQAIETGNFTFSNQYLNTPSQQIAHVITVGTPLCEKRLVNLNPLLEVINSLKKHLNQNDIVILRSTVRVGVTRDIVKQELDKCNIPYFLGFCPERTLEGSAFEELSCLPQIISGIDLKSIETIKFYFNQFSAEVVEMNSLEEAELTKLINNSERDLYFALANEIALMCDAKGLDAYNVIKAVNYKYPRSQIKKPGPSGGPCLSKDPYILTESFLSDSYIPRLFTTSRSINEDIIHISLKRISKLLLSPPKRVALLGFAFKGTPSTGDMRGSHIHAIIDFIKIQYPDAFISGHDYLADPSEMKKTGVYVAKNILDAVTNADLIILQNNHSQYAEEPWNEIRKNFNKNTLIFDFWNQLPACDIHQIDSYKVIGAIGNIYE